MNYSQAYRNRSNNDRGKLFERLIDQACWNYRVKEIAIVEKTPEPFSVKKKNKDGTFTGYFIGNAQPDYKGTIVGGRSIVFEAKVTSMDRISQNVVTNFQASCLEMHEQLGAVVGVCCMINKTVAFVPWSIWKDMKSIYGRKYILEKELREFQVPTPGYIDFLYLVLKKTSDADA